MKFQSPARREVAAGRGGQEEEGDEDEKDAARLPRDAFSPATASLWAVPAYLSPS